MIALKDSFYRSETKTQLLYMFWSKDWFSFNPWTFNEQNVGYISKHVTQREKGTMNTYFVGPLCVVVFKVKSK